MSARGEVSVLVVDDGPFRDVACDVVRAAPGFELVGAASSGEDAVELAAATSAQLALVDIRLPGLDGFETGKLLRRRDPATVVVLLSTNRPDEPYDDFELVAKDELSAALLRSVWERRPGGS